MQDSLSGDTTAAISHSSDSAAQREAERIAIAALAALDDVPLAPKRLELTEGVSVDVDGFHEGPPAVLVEAFAHYGRLRSAQRHKLMSDALMLATLCKKRFDANARLILLLTDPTAKKDLERGWRGQALEAFGIKLRVVALPEDVARRLRGAQEKQRTVNGDGGGDECTW